MQSRYKETPLIQVRYLNHISQIDIVTLLWLFSAAGLAITLQTGSTISIIIIRGRPINWFGRLISSNRAFHKVSGLAEFISNSARWLCKKIKMPVLAFGWLVEFQIYLFR